MFKGGYKIIDLKNAPFTPDERVLTINGIYDAIEASYEKPLMLAGLSYRGVEYGAAYVAPTVADGGAYRIEVYGLFISVRDDDSVTIEEP